MNKEDIILGNPRTSINIEDKTFNKICKLQKLIKKESALRRLCKYY